METPFEKPTKPTEKDENLRGPLGTAGARSFEAAKGGFGVARNPLNGCSLSTGPKIQTPSAKRPLLFESVVTRRCDIGLPEG